ncbi:DUF5331 domain-containing protein [Iningainema tapete]|uniref:DUF5331 domain-containing protein n=1 Tax=Iningainema tapete BLCC-T55 TaxID=2748662 RepID=A0A8J6XQU4_9CYAN|nr:DUF5331 domain-containing protein [Iningainema tapete]MBD2776584.1 DUF5331 domain-containing protein [Iningainema tapete BLCC-T55]
MSFFHSFTESIKQKWLQFFGLNQDWLRLHMEVESVYTPDGGKRPPSYLILGVVNALEPKLAQLMLPFSKLNQDADTLIEVLELHFDPDIALGNRVIPEVSESSRFEESEEIMMDSPNDETLAHSVTNGFGSGNHELEMLDDHEQTLMVSDTEMQDELRAISLDDVTQNNVADTHNGSKDHNLNSELHHNGVNAVDAFGDISFDDLKEVDSKNSTANGSNENGFAVVDDIWGDETSHKGEADKDIFGGEEISGSFDDSDIARLFPKA